MNKLICECCGGQINPRTYKCEYCGTQYKREYDDSIIRIEAFQNPVDTLMANVVVGAEVVRSAGAQQTTEIMLKETARKLSEKLIPYMTMCAEFEPMDMSYRMRGAVKVVKPEQVDHSWINVLMR